jgi:integrase/recombinase XerD
LRQGDPLAPNLLLGRGASRLYQWVKEVADMAGVEDLHPHTLRATFATHPADAVANARDIQRLLGHHSLTITERYIASTRTSRAKTITLL